MKRRGFLAAATAAAAGGVAIGLTNASTQKNGTLRTNVPMESEILGIEVPYTVYLPPPGSTDGNLPILYLLHGGADDNTAWPRNTDLTRALDDAITAEWLPPTVVVCPDARRDPTKPGGEQSETYYMNDADGEFRWEDMFIEEFMPHVESRYGAGGEQEKRGICGYSMGGFGALLHATLYPGTFVAAIGLSASHRTDDQVIDLDPDEYNRMLGSAFGEDLEGEDRLHDGARHYNIVDIIHRTPSEDLQGTSFYLDVGSDDEPALTANEEVRDALAEQEAEHYFVSQPGGHDWDFWQAGLRPMLKFLASRFPDQESDSIFALR